MSSSIGLFDSGVGGLTVLKALEELLPNENFIYFSDSAHFPYGKKSAAELIGYTTQITSFLLSLNIKMLVIPCHTASALVLSALHEIFNIPIVGMIETTVAALKATTVNKRIAIMGTEGTIHSGIYQNAIDKEINGAVLFPLTCPQLEQKIELGEPGTQEIIRACIQPILGKNIDTLLLACTHYPHKKSEIEEELDPKTVILDPAFSLAQEVKRQLIEKSGPLQKPKHIFYTSGNLELLQMFLNRHPPKAQFEIAQMNLAQEKNYLGIY